MRVIDKQGDIFGTMTPLKGQTFIYNEIYLNSKHNPEVWCEFMSWEDNPYLSKKEIKLLEATMDSPTLDSRRYGKFSCGAGLVYPEFDREVHVIKPFSVPKEWQDIISIDPGLNNPLSAHWYAVDWDGNIYVVAEHFAAGKDIDFHVRSIKDICGRIGWKTDSKGRIYALIDSAANQKTLASSKSVAELFCEQGILVNTKVNKDVFAGICRVKEYLKRGNGCGDIYVFDTCVNMIAEFYSYFWAEGDTPVKKDDHCMDELRYYVMSRPKSPEREESESIILKDKMKKARRLSVRGDRRREC
jgi:hypothetical protein